MRFPSLAETSAASSDRDRSIDALRALSLVVVVVGHAFMALPGWDGETLRLANSLSGSPRLQALTWILQLMPLFFFAGGAASAFALRRQPAYADWVWSRLRRLYRPVLLSTAFWLGACSVALALLPRGMAAPVAKMSLQLLWFLACYTLALLAAPALSRAARARPAHTTGLLLGGVVAVDVLAVGLHIPGVGLLNFALVWCLPFTLGLLYAEGRFHGHQALAAALVAFGTNVALVALGPYELSLVTVSGQRLSNMSPPSVVPALHAVVVCGLAAAARGPLTVLLTRPRVWWAVTVTNLSAMTIYLWHLPVLIAGLGVAGALGWNRPGPGEPHFWLASFALLAVFLLATATAVRLLWPTEHAALPWWDAPVGERPGRPAPPALVALAGSAVGVGTLLLAKDGLAGLTRNGAMTWPALAVMAGGLVACRALTHRGRHDVLVDGPAGGARHAAGARGDGDRSGTCGCRDGGASRVRPHRAFLVPGLHEVEGTVAQDEREAVTEA